MKIKGLSVILIFAIMMSLITSVISVGVYFTMQHATEIEEQLKADGFKILKAYADSSTIIVQETTNYAEFTDIVRSLNSTVIYKLTPTCYMVIANQTYACKYYV